MPLTRSTLAAAAKRFQAGAAVLDAAIADDLTARRGATSLRRDLRTERLSELRVAFLKRGADPRKDLEALLADVRATQQTLTPARIRAAMVDAGDPVTVGALHQRLAHLSPALIATFAARQRDAGNPLAVAVAEEAMESRELPPDNAHVQAVRSVAESLPEPADVTTLREEITTLVQGLGRTLYTAAMAADAGAGGAINRLTLIAQYGVANEVDLSSVQTAYQELDAAYDTADAAARAQAQQLLATA